MTKTEIASLAYSHLGGRAFADVDTDTTQQAVVCRKWFDAARDEILMQHPWNFAVRRRRVAPVWTALAAVALADNGSGGIRVTAAAHGRATGDRLHFQEVAGVTNANGTWFITVINSNTFDLDGSVFSGSHSSGTGSWILAPAWRPLAGVALADNGSGEIRVTAVNHGHTTGDRVRLQEVAGVTNANGAWYITVINANTFDLDGSVFGGSHSSGTGAWIQAPQFGWEFQHALGHLPETCLRVLKVGGDEGSLDEDGEDFQIEGGHLLTDHEAPLVRYVCRHRTYAAWPQDFITAFSYLLASYMATDLKGESGKGLELRQVYESTFLPKARGRDARESKPRRTLPFQRSQLLQARGGSIE